MTMPDAAEAPRDFTKRRPPLVFTIEPDTFKAPRTVNPIALGKIGAMKDDVDGVDINDPAQIQHVITIFAEMAKLLIPGPQGIRFANRLFADGLDPDLPPIDLAEEAVPALLWVIEQVAQRPTPPFSTSAPGPTDGETVTPSAGESSTAGVSPTGSPII